MTATSTAPSTTSGRRPRPAVIGGLLLLLILAAVLIVGMIRSTTRPDGRSFDQRVDAVASTLRCPSCASESVAQSRAPTANSMRQVIADQLAAGVPPDQIRSYFEQRYGEQVLLSPPAHGGNLLLWLLPPAAVLLAAAVLVRTVRRRPAAVLGEASLPIRAEAKNHAAGVRRYFSLTQPHFPLRGRVAGVAIVVVACAGGAVYAVSALGRGTTSSSPAANGASTTGPAAGVADLREAALEQPNDPKAWLALAEAEESADNWSGAAVAYENVLRLDPTQTAGAVAERAGLALLRAGRNAEASRIIRPVVAHAPKQADAVLILALAERKDDRADSDQLLRRYLNLAPVGPAAGQVRRLLAEHP